MTQLSLICLPALVLSGVIACAEPAIGPATSGEGVPSVSTAHEGLHSDTGGCGDHADEEAPGLRDVASRALTWKSSKRPGRTGTVDARILGFNDFHGQLGEGRRVANRPVGGAAVLASYLKAATAGYEDRSLIIHAGDHVGASPPESALLQDEPSIQFLNLLTSKHCRGSGYLAVRCNVIGTLGNHEFDEGKDELMRLVFGGNHAAGPFIESPYRGAMFPYVNANVVDEDTGRHILPPFVVRQLDGVRVGVIGAVLKETPTIVTPTGVAGLSFRDEAESINEQVGVLKRLRVSTIIVSIHQGAFQAPTYAGPTDPAAVLSGRIRDIVTALDGEVDVVISGHAHSFTNALVPGASGDPILVTQAFSASTAYGEIDLKIDRGTGDVLEKSARIVTTFSDVAPGNVRDPAVQALVEQAVGLTAPLVNQSIAQVSADVTRTQNAAGESALGNLIADAQRAAMGTDFAFMNPGGIRADLIFAANPANPVDVDGQVLWGELFTVQPFGNSLVAMSLTGQQIYDLLNQQLWSANRVLQISGLEYTWDASLPVGDRIVEVRTGGAAIDRTATYTVTANSFIAAGGDGFTVFVAGTGNVGGPVDLDALITYVQALPQPFGAPAVGRITRLN